MTAGLLPFQDVLCMGICLKCVAGDIVLISISCCISSSRIPCDRNITLQTRCCCCLCSTPDAINLEELEAQGRQVDALQDMEAPEGAIRYATFRVCVLCDWQTK